MSKFHLTSKYSPTGDQPEAIRQLTDGVMRGDKAQVLLGVTGSGKTFTVANVIKNVNKPTLILSHNKTLAAQLYEEMKDFFLTMLWNTTFLTMTTISRRLIFRRQTHTLRKTWLSTKR